MHPWRPVIASLSFCGAAALWMSSDLISVPVAAWPNALLVLVAPFTLGYFAGTPSAALALAFPVLFPLIVPGAVPENPDIPRYPELLSVAAAVLALPSALLAVGGARVQRVRAASTRSQ